MVLTENVKLSPADPDQVAFVPDLVFETNPALWSYVFFGQRSAFNQYIIELWPRKGNHLSHDIATAAIADHELIGIERGYSGAKKNSIEVKTAEALKIIYDDNMLRKLNNNLKKMIYITPYIPKSAYYLQSLSVASAGQNLGIGKLLLENVFNKARKKGLKSVHLDIYAENSAIGFYENMGMKLCVNTQITELVAHGIKTQCRMVKQL